MWAQCAEMSARLVKCLGQCGDSLIQLIVLDQNRWKEPGDGPADWQAVCDRLREAEDVGHDVLAAEGKLAACPKTGLDLVAYKKDAARVAAFADPFQVAVGGHSDTALPLDRLDDHGRDRVVQHPVEGAEVIEGDMASALEHRCEGIPILGVGSRGQGTEGASMVSPMRGND